MAGKERKYIAPIKPKFATKLTSGAFFEPLRYSLIIPTPKIITVQTRKNTKRYDGIVWYIWYLSESPSFILPRRVKIKLMRPNIETVID